MNMKSFNALEVNELELARKLFWLMSHDFIFFGTYNEEKEDWDSGAYPYINCNDIFVPGADAESLLEFEIDLYIDVCKKYMKDYPEIIWCIAKRNEKPWRDSWELTDIQKEGVEYTCNLLGTQNPLVT